MRRRRHSTPKHLAVYRPGAVFIAPLGTPAPRPWHRWRIVTWWRWRHWQEIGCTTDDGTLYDTTEGDEDGPGQAAP